MADRVLCVAVCGEMGRPKSWYSVGCLLTVNWIGLDWNTRSLIYGEGVASETSQLVSSHLTFRSLISDTQSHRLRECSPLWNT